MAAGDGWEAIDRIGAEAAFRVCCPMLQQVDTQHSSAWARAHGYVLRRWQEATTEEEVDRALMWLGFLPQALQRKSVGRGGKNGRNQIKYRYHCVVEGDWGGIVAAWERDREKLEERPRRERVETEEEAEARTSLEVKKLLYAGQVRRSMRRGTSHGLADGHSPEVLQQMRVKFPARNDPLPAAVLKLAPIDSFSQLRETLLSLEPGTSPGSGGCRPEYLVALGEKMEDREIERLEAFILAYTAGSLPAWFYRLWLSLSTVPLYKTAEQRDVRPLGIRHSLVRVCHMEVMTQSMPAIREFLEPQQLGMSRAGPAKLVNTVRGMMELHPNFVCCSLDLYNCYNEQRRGATVEVLQDTPSLQHLVTFAAAILAPEPALESGGRVWGDSNTGMGQGDPSSGAFQATGLHPSLLKLDQACRAGGGLAVAGADDTYAIGPPEVVLPAVQRYSEDIWARANLQLQWTKTKMYSLTADLPDFTPPGITLAGEDVDGVFERGVIVYGVPVGSSAYVTQKLRERASVIAADARRIAEVLRSDRQALWSALRLSMSQRFGYLQQHVAPSLTEPVARELDVALWGILETACGLKLPRGVEQGGLCLQVPAIPGLDGRSFQEWAVRLPVRLHGWGFRSLEENCGPAFLGTLETAIPFMTGRDGVCPALGELWGGAECWGSAAEEADRWRRVIESGSVIGQEINRLWAALRLEATQAALWLDAEVPKALACETVGIGYGCVTGETRGRVVEARENTRAKVLEKILTNIRPKSTRAAWAWRQRDKISSAWVLALPSADTALSNAEFAEAAASSLCLPSPACQGRVGEPIKGQMKIDEYGDAVQATALRGDHWRTRHDAMLHLLHSLCQWSGLKANMEVFNLFAGEVRQEGLNRAQGNRALQALVPDMAIVMPAGGVARGGLGVGGGGGGAEGAEERVGGPGGAALAGQGSRVLHELKVISCNSTRYKPSWKKRAVDVRALKLPDEYLEKARAADRRQGVQPGEVGRVEAKLVGMGTVRGLVSGNFGEMSEDTHLLVAAMANSRVRVAGPTRGRRGRMRGEEAERSIAVSAIRRRLGVMAVRCQSSSLLGRLETLGPGGAAAAGRRWHASELQRRWQQEDQANALARRQGFRALRTGFGKDD